MTYPWPLEKLFPGVPSRHGGNSARSTPEVFADATTWRSDHTSFVLRSGSRAILVEAGMGPADAPLAAAFGASGDLLDRVASIEVAPEDVDIVVLTHLHPDHVGWNVLPEDGGGFRLTDDIELMHTPGHTPGHLSVLVSSGTERAPAARGRGDAPGPDRRATVERDVRD